MTKPQRPNTTTERIHPIWRTPVGVGVHNSYTILRETFVAVVLVIVVVVALGEERVRARMKTSRTNQKAETRETNKRIRWK